MSHVKAASKANQKTDQAGKRRGVKVFGGQTINLGQIIIRQVGTKFHPGRGTDIGRDFTIFATRSGKVKYFKKQGKNFVAVVD
ncbi:MAG TPA: 50S ribosomal protein L27 [Candidatus Woesebacteria bacterium]|nr:50S ribosomal protein L27 [Candidatus Woesebacteria bacterium]HRS22967.1 50S ribosomal protein L27 [Candidatus Woesebacteria bacterium]HRT40126.1 50S ribosomal protein L27 [Candidatus Woesebacteria bacterium]